MSVWETPDERVLHPLRNGVLNNPAPPSTTARAHSLVNRLDRSLRNRDPRPQVLSTPPLFLLPRPSAVPRSTADNHPYLQVQTADNTFATPELTSGFQRLPHTLLHISPSLPNLRTRSRPTMSTHPPDNDHLDLLAPACLSIS
ncbi:hypothetical protein FA13DRAFT_1166376 [Coprinellus micaceus]|uniref:Uncharacterized protein n=1 Tax=Coprinellus micaceus TaxID=71717 RepID=A0A4Y7SUT1_COPMI|nr:hypothetical protein FA13DRAFT_1166376 [Coprinellus micaceus]